MAVDVNWYDYFKSIRNECPWSYSAYIKGLIDIVEYQGQSLPLGSYQARMYLISAPTDTIEAIAASLNYGDDDSEWLYSWPGYGKFATPVPVLIQQDHKQLQDLRDKLQVESQ